MNLSLHDKLNQIKKRYIVYFVLFVFALISLYQLDLIRQFIFDEYYYVPAARDWLNLKATLNLEHPPLGKYIIALGIKIFGLNPMGFRLMSVIAGSLIVLMIFNISLKYFKDMFDSLFATFLAIFNFWIFIFSRMATLDIYLILFFIIGLYFFYQFYLEQKEKDLYFLAVFLGLALATKWSGLFFSLPIIFMVFILLKRSGYLKIAKFIVVIISTYYLTFLPFLFLMEGDKYSLYDILISLPSLMYKLQNSVNGFHPYVSKWYTWPFMIRPMWFVINLNRVSSEFSGIMLIGNPVQMLLGLISIIFLIFKWRVNNKETNALLFIFLFSWIVWGLVQRNVSFIYYFFPSALLYSFFIPMSIKNSRLLKYRTAIYSVILVLSIIAFVHFYPLLVGQWLPLIDKENWIWFRTWI